MKSPMTFRLVQSMLVPLLVVLTPAAARAACDVDYVVQQGDTYYSIAQAHLGARSQWSMIYQANQSASGLPSLLPGNSLYIPCPPGMTVTEVTPTAALVTPSVPMVKGEQPEEKPETTLISVAPIEREYPDNPELRLVTGGDFKPFTDKTLPEQGLMTELVHAALDIAPSAVSYSVDWENDWSKHLDPMLRKGVYDMGFPWAKPDCATTPDAKLCQDFLFSDSFMNMPIMLFVNVENEFRFDSDADVVGKTICRPEGHFTHDLDRADRRWITDGSINLVIAETVDACFDMAMSGDVDAVSVHLFEGAGTILRMGLRRQIIPLERTLSEEGLHVIISKTHWRGTVHLYRVNAGLAALKADGRYQEIVARHLQQFQAQLQ